MTLPTWHPGKMFIRPGKDVRVYWLLLSWWLMDKHVRVAIVLVSGNC